MEELYEHRESRVWITDRFSKPDMARMLESPGRLMVHEYWWRIWIIQELIVAKHIVFYCGDNSSEGNCLHAVQ
jgi:hypothetical protein